MGQHENSVHNLISIRRGKIYITVELILFILQLHQQMSPLAYKPENRREHSLYTVNRPEPFT